MQRQKIDYGSKARYPLMKFSALNKLSHKYQISAIRLTLARSIISFPICIYIPKSNSSNVSLSKGSHFFTGPVVDYL